MFAIGVGGYLSAVVILILPVLAFEFSYGGVGFPVRRGMVIGGCASSSLQPVRAAELTASRAAASSDFINFIFINLLKRYEY